MSALVIKFWKAAVSIIGAAVFVGLSIAKESGSIGAFLITTLTGVVIALVYYFLNRTLTLGFVENSVGCGTRFQRSVIENVDADQEQAKAVCTIVQQLIEAKERQALQPRG
jgi:hypothetical protein